MRSNLESSYRALENLLNSSEIKAMNSTAMAYVVPNMNLYELVPNTSYQSNKMGNLVSYDLDLQKLLEHNERNIEQAR